MSYTPTLSQSGKQLARRLLKEHVKPYKKLFALACFFMMLAAMATAALPYLLQPVFDDVFTKADVSLLVIFCGPLLSKGLLRTVNQLS